MKTIGLLGGMSWESTRQYYRLINEGVKHRLGGLHSANMLIYSFDFAELAELQEFGDWETLGNMIAEKANRLEEAGADMLLICSNTMHKVADRAAAVVNIPILNIIDCTAQLLLADSIKKVALLGTSITMEDGFYQEYIARYGIECITPTGDDAATINRIIFTELCKGNFTAEARAEYARIIATLVEQGAEGVILGCTEIGLLLEPGDATVPIYDTTIIHAETAINKSLLADSYLEEVL